MDYILFRIVDFLIAICMASVIALTLEYVAHYQFGLSSPDIRMSALTGRHLRPANGASVVRKETQMTTGVTTVRKTIVGVTSLRGDFPLIIRLPVTLTVRK